MDKRGFTVSHVTIMVIIFIISFALIIILFSEFYDQGSNVDREICHSSILARHTLNYKAFEPGKDIPLNCKTEKITLEKQNSLTKEESKERILEELSDSILDCHTLIGEGHLNFMPTKATEKNYCFACARIGFDQELIDDVKDVSYLELYSYMASHDTNNGESYLQRVYNIKSIEDFDKVLRAVILDVEGTEVDGKIIDNVNLNEWKIDFSKDQLVLAQMTTDGYLKSFGGGALTFVLGTSLTALSVAFLPVGAIAGAAIVASGVTISGISGGLVYLQTFPDNEAVNYAAPTIFESYEDNPEVLDQLNCEFAFIP